MKSLNQKGFTAVETLLIIILLAILGGTGYYVWHANKTANNTYNTATKVAQSQPAKVTKKPQQYVTIKEWGVRLKLVPAGNDTTVYLKGNNLWLSTKTLDADPSCADYTSDTPTYNFISRYAATDKVSLGPGDGDVAASQAVGKLPSETFHKVGDHYYYFQKGNGIACQALSKSPVDFMAEFNSLMTE